MRIMLFRVCRRAFIFLTSNTRDICSKNMNRRVKMYKAICFWMFSKCFAEYGYSLSCDEIDISYIYSEDRELSDMNCCGVQ
jgi:hypothetical protein